MGKKSKIKSTAGDVVSAPSLPLHEQIEQSKVEKSRFNARVKDRDLKREHQPDEYISGPLSSKILKLARKQQLEEESEGKDEKTVDAVPSSARLRKISLGDKSRESSSDDDDDDNFESAGYDDSVVELNPEDEAAIEKFMIKKDTPGLFEIINEKIDRKRNDIEFTFVGKLRGDGSVTSDLDPDVVAMYREIGVILSKYRSGKIPKAFKVIPKMMNWEHLLYLTNPDKWSAAAMYQATRIFASNLQSTMCIKFYHYILLPRLRDDIVEYKKLNFHLYQALHKALYKPQAFFKGIIMPLCQSGTCTLREATIFGSVLAKASIPMLNSAAAILRITELEYTGANSLFLRILIEKKYTLPARVTDALVNHFLQFSNEERQMPVLWHQSLLAFVTLYKKNIDKEARRKLLELIKIQNHYQISPEIRKELQFVESTAEAMEIEDSCATKAS